MQLRDEGSRDEIWYPLERSRADVQQWINEGEIEIVDADQDAGARLLDLAEMNLSGAYLCRGTDWVGAYTLVALTSVRALRSILRAEGLHIRPSAGEAFLLAAVARVQFHDGLDHVNLDFRHVSPMVRRVRTIDEPRAQEFTQNEVDEAVDISYRLMEFAADVIPHIPAWRKAPDGAPTGLPQASQAQIGPVTKACFDVSMIEGTMIGSALSSSDQSFIGLYAFTPRDGTYIRGALIWHKARGPALNKLNGVQLVEAQRSFIDTFDRLDAIGVDPTIAQIARGSTSGNPASWDMQN